MNRMSNEDHKEQPNKSKLSISLKKRRRAKYTVDIIKDVTVILTCVSLITGFILSGIHLRDAWHQEKFVGLSQARDVIDKEDLIQDRLAAFMLRTNDPSPEALLAKYGSGRAVYYAEEMKPFRVICRHYEKVGALMSANYIDFDLYYHIEVFPDAFWEGTAELRKVLKENWGGEGKPLDDFLNNFEHLHEMYQKRRASGE